MGLDRAFGVEPAVRLFGRDPLATLALLRAAWSSAVGRDVSRRTEVLSLQRGVLRVRVPDAGWRKVLHRMEREILARLRQTAGSLTPARLAYSEGPAQDEADPPRPAGPGRTSSPADVPASVREGAEAIADPEIRAAFLRSAALYLRERP